MKGSDERCQQSMATINSFLIFTTRPHCRSVVISDIDERVSHFLVEA